MARTVTYGMGQYRYNPTFEYIGQDQVFDGSHPEDSFGGHKNIEYFKNNAGGINYQDVLLTFTPPTGTTSNYIQYNTTYYMELTVPQHRQYPITLNLKLCAGDGKDVDTSRFQNIKRLTIPATPKLDDFFSDVILFEDPTLYEKVDNIWVLNSNVDEKNAPIMKASVFYKGVHNKYLTINDLNNATDLSVHEVYFTNDSGYRYITNKKANGTFENIPLIGGKYSTSQKLEQSWKLNQETERYGMPTTVTYKFAFSPKYNLSNGFPFLLLETDRSGNESHTLQYEGSDKVSYNGTCLDLNKIKVNIYTVSNLLSGASNGTGQIQSGTSQLTHIAVNGHPEQILTINGEEIKIGRSGFYEIKDYEISSLGVVVVDSNKDRFTIDYEYKIVT